MLPGEQALLLPWSRNIVSITSKFNDKLTTLADPPPTTAPPSLKAILAARAGAAQANISGRSGKSTPDITDLPGAKRSADQVTTSPPRSPPQKRQHTVDTELVNQIAEAVMNKLKDEGKPTIGQLPVAS